MPQNRANRIGWRVISFWAGKWLRREILGCFFGFGCCWGESDVGWLFPIETWTEISSALRLSSVYDEVQGGRRALRAGAVFVV